MPHAVSADHSSSPWRDRRAEIARADVVHLLSGRRVSFRSCESKSCLRWIERNFATVTASTNLSGSLPFACFVGSTSLRVCCRACTLLQPAPSTKMAEMGRLRFTGETTLTAGQRTVRFVSLGSLRQHESVVLK